jgi:hypothetical protein
MRVRFTESFPGEAAGAEATWRLVRKIVEDRLAEEVTRRQQQKPSDAFAPPEL